MKNAVILGVCQKNHSGRNKNLGRKKFFYTFVVPNEKIDQSSLKRSLEVRELSSVGSERLPYKQRVGGSTPSAPTSVRSRSKSNFEPAFLYQVGRGPHLSRIGAVERAGPGKTVNIISHLSTVHLHIHRYICKVDFMLMRSLGIPENRIRSEIPRDKLHHVSIQRT